MTAPAEPLPAELQERLEALLFRSGAAPERASAIERLCEQHPDHEGAIRAWCDAVDRLGDGRFDEDGRVVGPFRLLSLLGSGGFGEVYLAEQLEPVRRRVALKVLKPGMDSAAILARFAREQEALGRMSHDAIARIHEAGVTPAGQPYFAMELVEGEPITVHCDRRGLGLRDRLGLFVKVCLGVHHAHQKGVIHRDLKPGNILVATIDGEHVPKLIDFGIARSLEADASAATLTETGVMLGTPAYMAPEQARGELALIDTRTDVYALGAILYELLTGFRPWSAGVGVPTSTWALRERILRAETPRPSRDIGVEPGTLAQRARDRGLSAGTWHRSLRGDLDWIVLLAMAKEPERRYPSAAELAADVQRHLQQEPVLAGPPSAAYRLRKFVRRYRLQVLGAGAVLATAVAGSIATWRWARIAEANATLARQSEASSRQRAEDNARLAAERADLAAAESSARAAAELRALQLQQVVEFQSAQLSDIDVPRLGERLRAALLAAVPAEARAATDRQLAGVNFTDLASGVLEQNLFERSLVSIRERFAGQPLLQASLLQVLAETMSRLGLFAGALAPQREALELRRTGLGDDDPDTLVSIASLAILLQQLGRLDEAEALFRESYAALLRIHGPADPESLSAIHNLGFLLRGRGKLVEAEQLFRECWERCQDVLTPIDIDRLRIANNLGTVLLHLGRAADAEPLLTEVLATTSALRSTPELDEVARTAKSLMAWVHRERGQAELAEELLREVLDARRDALGERHPETLTAMGALGDTLAARGDHRAAEPLLRECLRITRSVRGELHAETLACMNSLASLLHDAGNLAEAEGLHRAALAGRRQLLGDEHHDTLTSGNNLAAILLALGRPRDAEPLFRDVLAASVRVLGEDHPRTLATRHNLALVLKELGQPGEAEPQFREVLARQERLLGSEHPQTLMCRATLATVLHDLRRFDDAEPMYRETVAAMRRAFGDEHPQTLSCLGNLGAMLVTARRYEDAAPIVEEVLVTLRDVVGNDHPQTLGALYSMLQLQLQRGDLAAAEAIGREAVATSERVHGGDHPTSLRLANGLAVVLERMQRFDAAEPLYRRVLAVWLREAGERHPETIAARLGLGAMFLRAARFPAAEEQFLAAWAAGGEGPQGKTIAGLLARLYAAWHAASPDPDREGKAAEWRQRAGS